LKFKNILWEISGDLKDLDNKINSREIFDYEVIFEKDKNFYLINENIVDLENKLELDSITAWIWNLKISSWSNSVLASVKSYSWYKFIKEDQKNWNETFTWTILKNQNYKFEATYSWSVLNNLYITPFDKQGYIKLIKIDSNIWSYLNEIKVTNILWKKKFWDNDSINKIVLTFEDDLGKSEILEIKK
jgi:hypothetical protein